MRSTPLPVLRIPNRISIDSVRTTIVTDANIVYGSSGKLNVTMEAVITSTAGATLFVFPDVNNSSIHRLVR